MGEVIEIGTNAGFVTEAPVEDALGVNGVVSNVALAIKGTAPVGAVRVTEIGWWCDNATEEANFEVGIYNHNVGDNEPEDVVGSLSQTNAKGTTTGWKSVVGLNIPITAGEIYWMALQVDETSTSTKTNYRQLDGELRSLKGSPQTTLTDPWGTPTSQDDNIRTIYAVWSAAGPVGDGGIGPDLYVY